MMKIQKWNMEKQSELAEKFLGELKSGNRVTYATVNGVTGKIAADIPIDIKRYCLGSMLAAIPFFALFMLLPTFVPRITLYIASILLIIGFIAVIVESKSVSKREKNVGDKAMQKRMVNNDDEIPKTNNYVSMGLSVLASILLQVIHNLLHPCYRTFRL